jgi:hypothetical protein
MRRGKPLFMSERRTEKKPEIDPGLLDELLKQYERHEEATRGYLSGSANGY